MDESQALVALDIDGAVGVLTLQRADQYNALSSDLIRALNGAITRVVEDSNLRALVVTGAGKAFCAGADIKEFETLDGPVAFRAFLYDLERTLRRFEQIDQPCIAAVNGVALGGGLELALACDLRIADAKARLGVPEIKLGILPGAGGTQRLPRVVPPAIAHQMILTGDPIDATEAHRIGLVNEVVEAGAAVERARALAATLAERPPLALAAAKRLRDHTASLPLDAGLDLERETVSLLFGTEDRAEGTAAFVQKRTPQFRGR